MKKALTLVVFFFSAAVIFCNPLVPALAVINELKFQQGNSWIIEIIFANGPFLQTDFDSICISSSQGTSRININNITDSTSIYLFTSDSLLSPLNINRNGDYLMLTSYRKESPGIPISRSLAFGNYTGSQIPGILPIDYSISRFSVYLLGDYWEVYSRDKSPSIGLINDTAGTQSILTGFLYDKNDSLLNSGSFLFSTSLIQTDSAGAYTASLFSHEYTVLSLFDNINGAYLKIDSLYFDAYPAAIINKDIHFKDYVVNAEEKIKPETYNIELINYPNPFNSATNFFIKLPADLTFQRGEINIYNVNGEKVSAIYLKENSPAAWNGKNMYGGDAASGIYYYRLVLDNKVYKYGSMVLLK